MSDLSRQNRHLYVHFYNYTDSESFLLEQQREQNRHQIEMQRDNQQQQRHEFRMQRRRERNEIKIKQNIERHELDMEQRHRQHQVEHHRQIGQQTQIWQQSIWQQPIWQQSMVQNQINIPNNHREQPQPQNENNEIPHPLLLPITQIAEHLTGPMTWERFFLSHEVIFVLIYLFIYLVSLIRIYL